MTPINSPPARDQASMVYDEDGQSIILFGGDVDNGNPFNDTWALSFDSTTQTYTWTNVSPPVITPTNNPSARFGTGMAYDTVKKKIILFGGGTNNDTFNDTWKLDFDSNNQTYNWTQITTVINPPASFQPAMSFDASSKNVVLFGGLDENDNALQDTWKLNFDSNSQTYSWTDISSINSPSARYNAQMVYDSLRKQSILFGGLDYTIDNSLSGSGNPLNDTWALNLASNLDIWTNVSPTTSPPNRTGALWLMMIRTNKPSYLEATTVLML